MQLKGVIFGAAKNECTMNLLTGYGTFNENWRNMQRTHFITFQSCFFPINTVNCNLLSPFFYIKQVAKTFIELEVLIGKQQDWDDVIKWVTCILLRFCHSQSLMLEIHFVLTLGHTRYIRLLNCTLCYSY